MMLKYKIIVFSCLYVNLLLPRLRRLLLLLLLIIIINEMLRTCSLSVSTCSINVKTFLHFYVRQLC